jgi:hypothetical protein
MINVSVTSSGQSHWTEQWTPLQLTYFLLMSGAPEPKFAATQSADAVPYGPNLYRWDPPAISEAEFDKARRQLPRSTPRPFVPADCERVSLSLVPGWSWGTTLSPRCDRPAIEALIDLCQEDMQYQEFSYHAGQHVYQSILTAEKLARLRQDYRRGYKTLASISSKMAEELRSDRAAGRPLAFGCREPGFTVPLSIWYEY